MVPVTPQTHAWAYEDKDPQRLIATLELLGDVYYTEMVSTICPGHAGTHTATATTDNQGNKYIINKHYTNKYPNMCLLMYLVEQLTRHDLYLRVTHKDRTQNEFNLIIAGIEDKTNDFYIIPYPAVAHMFIESSLQTGIKKNRTDRSPAEYRRLFVV